MGQDFQQPNYYDPNFGAEPEYDPEVVASAEKKAKIARILSLIGFIYSFFCGSYVSIGLGIASLILGNKALALYPEAQTGKGKAIASIIIGAIGIVAMIVVYVVYFIVIMAAEGMYY